MAETVLTKASRDGWPGASRNDLPAYDRNGTLKDGDTTQVSVLPMRARATPHTPAVRKPVYQYVDTGSHAVHQSNVLWSDSASWCTIVALWKMNRAGLAHVVPGGTAARDTATFLTAYGQTPTEIHLATMPQFFNKADGFRRVLGTIRHHYGNAYGNIKIFLISGYDGHDWAQKHQLAVDPKSGAYPVFN